MDGTRYGDDGSPYLVDDDPHYWRTIRACMDCAYLLMGGSMPEGAEEGWTGTTLLDREAREAREERGAPHDGRGPLFLADGARTVWDSMHGEALIEWGFGTYPCQGCGSGLAGDRYPVDVFLPLEVRA